MSEGTEELIGRHVVETISGGSYEVGPTRNEVRAILDVVTRWPRETALALASEGLVVPALLGLLDGGATLDEVVDCLIVHGDLPSPEATPVDMRLTEAGDGWHLEPKAS